MLNFSQHQKPNTRKPMKKNMVAAGSLAVFSLLSLEVSAQQAKTKNVLRLGAVAGF